MRTLVGAAVLVLALSACGEKPVGIGPGASGPSGAYVSQSAPNQVDGTTVRLDFTDDGRIVATAGCNTLSGTVDTGGGTVAVGTDLSTTEMGCAPELHAQDEWLSDFLSASPEWRIDGERLVLTGKDAELVLERQTAPPLLGTTWQVDSLLSGDVVSSTTGTATLEFAKDTVAIKTGCNSGSAGYRLSGDSIVFDEPVLTKMGCVDPALVELEQTMTAVLHGKAELTSDGDAITLTKDGKGIRLTAS